MAAYKYISVHHCFRIAFEKIAAITFLLCLLCCKSAFSGCKIKNTSEGSIVHCANQRLSVFPNLPNNTITADLHGNVLPFLRRENFKRLRNVKSLTLSNCNTKGIEEGAFEGLSRLERLRLGSNGLILPPTALLPLVNVVHLDLSYNSGILGHRPWNGTFKGLHKLQFLSLRATGIEVLPDDIFHTNQLLSTLFISLNHLRFIPLGLISLVNLKDLNLSENLIQSVNVNATFQTKAPTFKLHLLDNKLRKLDRKDLTPLRKVKHLTINLRRNRIANIAQDTFVDLKNIVKLDISENPLCQNNAQETNESLEDINVQSWPSCNAAYNLSMALRSTKVANLVLEHIGWKTYRLKEDGFVNLKNSSLRLLKLGGNNFGRIQEDAFQHVSTLHSLSLDNCAIDTIPANAFAPLKWLRSLHLERNNLETFLVQNVLDFCPRLSFIDVSENKFKNSLPNGTIERYVIENHTKISTIKLSHNNLNLVLVFESLTALRTLEMNFINESPKNFKFHQLQLHNLPSLLTLEFRGNKGYLQQYLDHHLELTSSSIFEEVPSLEKLDLSYNDLYRSPSDLVMTMLKSLTSLKELFMSKTIDKLSPGMFASMQNLQYLSLSNNKLKFLPRNIFRNLRKLKALNLGNNFIGRFQEGLFDRLDSLTTIDISTNKLICDCQIRPLQKWLDNHKHITVKGRHDYCFAPASTTSKRIQEYRPSWLDCDNNLVILLASSSGSLFCVVTIALVIYVLRWDIKFAIAVRRARRFPRKHARRGKEFDAFVSYCPHDIAWVKDALIAKVEEDQYFNFHLCVHERDFLAGKFIVENIEENVEKSKKIIFVVTESFLASEYCDLEVNLAKTKLFEGSIDSVVFICFGMIKKSKMSEPMNTMMRHSCVLYWPQEDRLRERAIFWKKLKLALWSKQDFVMDETLL